MVETCVMASATYPAGIFHQEQGFSRAPKVVNNIKDFDFCDLGSFIFISVATESLVIGKRN